MKVKSNTNCNKYLDNINMSMSFGIALLMIIIIGVIISAVVPDILDVEYIRANYINKTESFVAEKSERMQYFILTISFPIIYVCAYKILQRMNIEVKDSKKAYNIFTICNVVIIIGLLCWIIVKSKMNLIIQILISSMLCGSAIAVYKMLKNKKIMKYMLYVATVCIVGTIAYLYINPTFEQIKYISHHVDAYYYPLLKISSGLTPYIDFTPLYGCYSYVFALLQNIFNNSSFMFFSIINAILVALVLTNLAIVISKNIKNKAVAFVTTMAMIFLMIIYSFIKNKGPYIQYMPHRVLFNSIILLLINIYLKYRNTNKKAVLQILGFLISAFAIFWNIETGIIVLIVWTAFLGYEVLFFNSLKNKNTYISIAKILVMAIISLATAYFMVAIISYIRTGTLVSMKNMLASQLLFYQDGFNMIKMHLGKPWMILIYTYLIGLAITLRKLYFINPEKRILFNKYSMIFTLSILGIGVFSYYQGRSHDDVFASVTYPGIILIGIFTDILLKRISISKTKKIQIANIVIVSINIMFLSLLAMSTISSLISNKDIHFHMNKKQLSSETILEDFSDYDTSNVEFISDYESLYYKNII